MRTSAWYIQRSGIIRIACVDTRSEVNLNNAGSEMVRFAAVEGAEGMAVVTMASAAVVIAGAGGEESGGRSHERTAE